jgi:hypothetical protein
LSVFATVGGRSPLHRVASTLERSSITKQEFQPTDYVNGWWLKDKWRNLDHHSSLLQCCSSSMVQDGDHDLRTSGEIFLSLQGRSRWLRWWHNQE